MPHLLIPVLSPEHGAYIVVAVSFLVGVINAGTWNLGTTVALVCAFAGFQAQFPVTQMLRRGIVWRLLFWAAVYGALAVIAAYWLIARTPALMRIVWAITAVLALTLGLSLARRYKSLEQELIVFAGLALAAPWAQTATNGFMSHDAMALWIVRSLAFWGSVFAVRIRSRGLAWRTPTAIYALGAFALAVILAIEGITP